MWNTLLEVKNVYVFEKGGSFPFIDIPFEKKCDEIISKNVKQIAKRIDHVNDINHYQP